MAGIGRAPPVFGAARRVVVTGIGLVTPLGVGVEHVWPRLLEGECGVVSLPDSFAALPSRIAGLVTGFDPSRWFDQRAATTLPPNIQFGVAAAEMALEDAGWPSSPQGCSATGSQHPDGLSAGPPGDRTGVAIGCGISGVGELLRGAHLLETKGYRRVSPFLVPNALVNMTAGMVAIRRGLRGPNHAASTACATGAHSIGDAFRFVSLGDADVMVCGGADACIEPIVVAGFSRANALATKYNDDPAAASRPFDVDRSGFVIAEGAGVLVLEELDHAVARGARIYCELRGYGLSSDAHHITSPDPQGTGAFAAMSGALQQAAVSPEELGYVNAHATSTPTGDAVETLAVSRLVGGSARKTPVLMSSTKGATGHLLGAAGAVEAAFTALALHHGAVPATINTTAVEQVDGVEIVVGQSIRDRKLDAALCNSFGFGGINASLCFTQL